MLPLGVSILQYEYEYCTSIRTGKFSTVQKNDFKIGYFDHFRVRIKHVDILYKTIKKSFDLNNFWESVVRLR